MTSDNSLDNMEHAEEIVYKFSFSKNNKVGYNSVFYSEINGVPVYNKASGYGFINKTCAHPSRIVHTKEIMQTEKGFEISETEFYGEIKGGEDDYNNFGMAFRVDVPRGGYEVHVRTTSSAENTMISISGMNSSKILKGGFWDAAGFVPIMNVAKWKEKEWTYNYVNGQGFIDIEIEPIHNNISVGVEEIILKSIPQKISQNKNKPTIFTLGDSTIKSYVFEEAPMSSWGQIFHKMFNLNMVNVINYSQGGRSFKSSYAEGRFNDLLLNGKRGDYVLIQFGHNDVKDDENIRFGRGTTDEVYKSYIKDIYLPAIKAMGMIPILVTPMSSINGEAKPGDHFVNSFNVRKLPEIMKKSGEELAVTVIDLNSESINYYNEIGAEATIAIFMSIEAGEAPGKSNAGSYANGHPSGKIDGTHYKEALAKQFARIIVTEIYKKGTKGDIVGKNISSYFKNEVKEAIYSNNWAKVFSEMAKDVITGKSAYYRNQIEKMLQLGILQKDEDDNFNPHKDITIFEYISSICKLMNLDKAIFRDYKDEILTREIMGAILYDAYQNKFENKPKYMTDYNGTTITPDDPNYDPNLDADAQGIMYYPIVPYEKLKDIKEVSKDFANKVKTAYVLGLIRAENGILRGKVMNGDLLQPKDKVSREKAAKSLYFMWVLSKPVKVENDLSTLL